MQAVAQISTGKKALVVARVAAREAQRHAQRSRWGRGALAGGRAVLGSALKAAHILWLQITGVFFVFFALASGIAFWKEYHAWGAGKVGAGRWVLALCVCVIFAWFGVSSFWRAKHRS